MCDLPKDIVKINAIKCMIVGDSKSGKTHLYKALLNQPVPKEYETTVFDVQTEEVDYEGGRITLTLWDSAGSNIYDSIRPISYAHTDCFIICYAAGNKESYTNIEERFLPEIKRHGDGPKVPIMLVETKCDDIHSLEGAKHSKTKPCSKDTEGKGIDEEVKAHAIFQLASHSKTEVQSILLKMIELASQKKIEEEKPPNPIWKFQSLNVIITGDEAVGKTSIVEACIKDQTIIANRKANVHRLQEYYHDFVSNGCEYFLRIIELPFSYSETLYELCEQADVIIMCYSIEDPFSFQSVDLHSRNMSKNLSKDVPIILIANKCDLKEESDSIVIPTADGEELKQDIKCAAFIECSAKTFDSISKVFHTIADIFSEEDNKTNNPVA